MPETYEKTIRLNIVKHPIVSQNIAIIRDKNTNCQDFRTAAKKIADILLYEATKNLPTTTKKIQTPLETTEELVIDENYEIIISPILRAGLILEETALNMLPMAKVFHIGMYRNEETLNPVWYYNKLPKTLPNPQKSYVYLLDPMLATGGSLLDTIKLYADKNVPLNQIKVICLMASPDGVNRLQSHYPDTEIITATLDREINKKGYILPGLGDAGDRIFNTL